MNADDIARGFADALRAGQTYTPPSSLGSPLDLAQAYAVQTAFVALRTQSERVVGYKAAANAQALQQRLRLDEPVVGALFEKGAVAPGATVRAASYRTLLIETELGFRTARAFDKPVATTAELRNAIASVMPMFELADPGFGRQAMVGTDLIAANSASASFVCGPSVPVRDVDPNAVRVTLRRAGDVLHEAEGRELAGDQWRTLQWLVNTLIAKGYTIAPGDLLMTGSLGPAHPASAGTYAADFGVLGTLDVTVA